MKPSNFIKTEKETTPEIKRENIVDMEDDEENSDCKINS